MAVPADASAAVLAAGINELATRVDGVLQQAQQEDNLLRSWRTIDQSSGDGKQNSMGVSNSAHEYHVGKRY